MEKNENKKRLFKNKKIIVIAVITVVIAIAVTVVTIIVPRLKGEVRDEEAIETVAQKQVEEDISSQALAGTSFNLSSNVSLASFLGLEIKTFNVTGNFSRGTGGTVTTNSYGSLCTSTPGLTTAFSNQVNLRVKFTISAELQGYLSNSNSPICCCFLDGNDVQYYPGSGKYNRGSSTYGPSTTTSPLYSSTGIRAGYYPNKDSLWLQWREYIDRPTLSGGSYSSFSGDRAMAINWAYLADEPGGIKLEVVVPAMSGGYIEGKPVNLTATVIT